MTKTSTILASCTCSVCLHVNSESSAIIMTTIILEYQISSAVILDKKEVLLSLFDFRANLKLIIFVSIVFAHLGYQQDALELLDMDYWSSVVWILVLWSTMDILFRSGGESFRLFL